MKENQGKVTIFINKINNSRVEITRFTQFDELHNKQGNVIKFLEEKYQKHVYTDITLTRCLG